MSTNCLLLLLLNRWGGIWEKYFVIQKANELNNSSTYEDASVDFDGTLMNGSPLSSTTRRFSFCLEPGEYTLSAIDTQGDGWWGGAFYLLVVDGVTVVREEMGRLSPSKQSVPFTIARPRTAFAANKAPEGGGGALFWSVVQPENSEQYRNESDSNEAAYGSYIATPARYG